MSSHVLDLSGQRSIQVTLNDPATTKAYVPAKQGDDTSLSFGGREIRVGLPTNARIQRRKYVRDETVMENGRAKRRPDAEIKPGETVYETMPVEYEMLVLVVGSSLSGFIRSSLSEAEKQAAAAEGRTLHEMHTHTSVLVRRQADDLHFLESGELIEELEVGPVLDGDAALRSAARALLDAMGRDASSATYSLNAKRAAGDLAALLDGAQPS